MKLKKSNIKILVLGGSRGIGKSIVDETKKNFKDVTFFSSKDVDTSNLDSIKKFNKKYKSADVIILNSGGPPNIPFAKIDEETWYKFFNQLFLGFCMILRNITIKKNGYIFYISSSVIKALSPLSCIISHVFLCDKKHATSFALIGLDQLLAASCNFFSDIEFASIAETISISKPKAMACSC